MSRRVRILVMAACATLAIPACTGSDHVGAAIVAGGPDHHVAFIAATETAPPRPGSTMSMERA